MTDLIIGSACIVAGVSGLIMLHCINRRLPAYNARRAALQRKDITDLRAMLARLNGEAMTCARKNRRIDSIMMWAKMLPVLIALNKKEAARGRTRTVSRDQMNREQIH